MNTLFEYCCDIINYIAATFNISYAECNILIFLHILPAVYLLNTIIVLIFGFFKKSKIFGLFCIIGASLLSMYEIEFLWNMLMTYELTDESFNLAVNVLNNNAIYYNTTYEIINIIYFIIIPIINITLKFLLIISNNKFSNKNHEKTH